MSKSLFASKTFWFNIASALVYFSGALAPKFAVPLAAVGNIIIRVLTSQPVTVLPQ